MLNLFESAYEDNVPLSHKVSYLESTCHFSSFSDPDEKSLNEVNAKIKVYLGSQTKSFEGLLLLKQVIEQCSENVFSANALSWAQQTVKVLQNSGESSGSRKFACNVISSILENVQSLQNVRKQTSISVVPGLLETVLGVSIDDEWVEHAVACLAACLRYFPGPCGLRKGKIRDFLYSLLDNWEYRAFEPLAVCFCHLPACLMDCRNKVDFNAFWTDQVKVFINTLHSILNSIAIGTGVSEVNISSTTLFDSVPEDPFSCALKQASRFKAIGQCLAKMLVSQIQYKVLVPFDALLNFVSRTFSITSADFVYSPFVMSVIPVLHLTGLTILESLILSCNHYLLHVFHHIKNLLIQVLKANECNTLGLQSQFSVVRCATYRVFQACLQKLKYNNSVGSDDIYFPTVMIKDVKPRASDVKLVTNLTQKTCLMDFVAPGEDRRMKYSVKTCTEALRALKAFITFGSQCPDIYMDIFNAVTTTVLQIQQNPLDLCLPYSDETCRAELYSLLQIASTKLYYHQRSSVHLSLALISSALEDSSTMVSQVCRKEFNTLNVIIRSCHDTKPDNRAIVANLKESYLKNKNVIIESIGAVINEEPSLNHIITNSDGAEVPYVDYGINAEDSASQGSMNIEEINSSDEMTEERVSPTRPNEDVNFESLNCFPVNNEQNDDIKQNGILSEGHESDQECSSRKRHFSSSNSEIPPHKKVAGNCAEEEESDVISMIRDFAPTSPDNAL